MNIKGGRKRIFLTKKREFTMAQVHRENDAIGKSGGLPRGNWGWTIGYLE